MKAALFYAQRLGWRVVPLHSFENGACSCGGDHLKPNGTLDNSRGKHPRLNDWTSEASADPVVVEAWIAQCPTGNVGVATGSASGFFVLDVDPDHGGAESLASLIERHGPLPVTAKARTGSGGHHYLFKMPGHPVTNSGGKIGKGIDIRGDGGQIVAAPSVSAKGPYTWVNAPWDTQIADAPEWLLTLIKRAPGLKLATSEGRGFFPAATADVLEQARQAIARHGPAIDGEGGGIHTVHGAAILTHDFALTDDEAWPLFLEWNTTCVPPWVEAELRVMMSRGRKYGKLEYGCRRELDPLEAARKLIADWQLGNRDEAKMFPMLQSLRALQFDDPAKRGIVLAELKQATGIGSKEANLPSARAPAVPLKRGEIQVTTELAKVADESTRAIEPHVFQRNGVLCEIVTGERTFIHDLEGARIQDLMSRHAVYVRQDDKGIVHMAAPERVASMLQARRGHENVRVLEAVTTAPVFLADGTILQTRGYSPEARVYLEPSVEVDVPERPTQRDARAAVLLFKDLVCDYRFASGEDFSSWLAAVLSPLVKSATRNAPAPLICISASSPGVGKTMLANLAALVVTGAKAEIRPYNPRDPSEWGKRMTAFVRGASPISLFDNVNGAIGDEGLDRLITSSTWSDRVLGASDAPPMPNVTTWMATGNNIEPVGDTIRRVLICRVNTTSERPQEATGFKRPLLEEYALASRAELLSAALTILRAFHVAGRPVESLAPWGSFTEWSGLVRGALVWTGLPDPFLTQRRASEQLNEPEQEAHDFWISVVKDSDGSPASMATLANARDAASVLGARESFTPALLRKFIARFIDKPRGGVLIRKDRQGTDRRAVYYLETISP